jgi:hypothetical protein
MRPQVAGRSLRASQSQTERLHSFDVGATSRSGRRTGEARAAAVVQPVATLATKSHARRDRRQFNGEFAIASRAWATVLAR